MGFLSSIAGWVGCGAIGGLKNGLTWLIGKIFGALTGNLLSADAITIILVGIGGGALFFYELKNHAVALILITAVLFGVPFLFC
jgi:hypothetical protein